MSGAWRRRAWSAGLSLGSGSFLLGCCWVLSASLRGAPWHSSLLFLSLPRGTLASHPPGSAFIRQAAKPPGPDWRSLVGVYALRLCLGSHGFSGCLLLPLAQDALPHGSMGSQPNLSLLLCPPVAPMLANQPRAFTMREGCLSEFILFGIKMFPGRGFWREEGGAASLLWGDALQGGSFRIPCPSPSEPVLCLLLIMEMIYVLG